MIDIIKKILYGVILVSALAMLAAMFIDANNTPLAEHLAKYGLYGLVGGIIMYCPIIILEKFKK